MSSVLTSTKKRFELREPLRSFLHSLRNIFNADACALYLISDNMDIDEKKEEFVRRFKDCPKNNSKDGLDIKNASGKAMIADDHMEYDILKFIGVDDYYKDDKGFAANHWSYDYKNRPHKYIVIKKCDCTYIYGEGITGLTARSKKMQHLIGNKIDRCPSRSGEEDTERNIHPKCVELISIPIINKDIDTGEEFIRGVVRLDVYDVPGRDEKRLKYDSYFGKKNGGIKELNSIINDLSLQLEKISSKDAEEKSYNKLFQGIEIIKAIKTIGEIIGSSEKKSNSDVASVNVDDEKDREKDYNGLPDVDRNKEIYDLTRHLFFVFQRYTYIGYDEIMERVLYYIKDVFDCLNMSDYYKITEERLLKFRDHEQLMLYSTDKYRDHFMHQFHVFVLGYIFLNFIGIDVVKDRINNRLEKTLSYDKVKIDEEGVLRMWALIAMFHDITYIFEKYDKTMQKFISEQLFAEIPVHVDWGSILSDKGRSNGYIDSLCKLTEFFESPIEKNITNKTELFGNYIQALQDHQDHGLISAILLINLFIDSIKKKYNNNPDEQNKRAAEIYLSALAISMHNECVFNTLKEDMNNRFISFEGFPLEFLLMYCDTVQEWGRKKEIDKVFYDAPVLKEIALYGGKKKKEINCDLQYLGAEVPDENKLNGFLEKKILKFCSSEVVFNMTYSYKRRGGSTAFTFYRQRPDGSDNQKK